MTRRRQRSPLPAADLRVGPPARASIDRRDRRRRTERGGRELPPLPPPRRVARARGAREAGGVSRRGVLGPAAARLRRPGGARADPRAGPGGARRQPDRPHLHRRPLRRLPVRLAAPDGAGQPARERGARRRAAPRRRLCGRRGALRPAAQPPHAAGAGELRRVAGARGGAAGRAPRRRLPRRLRLGGRAAAAGRARRRGGRAPEAAVRPRRAGGGRPVAAARVLSPEPAEHLHRQADPRHDGRGVRAGKGARLGRMSRYAEIFRAPYVRALVASALLARLPIGINGLAIVLFLRERTGSFTVAGAVAGSLAAGSGLGAPVVGRLVDRLGPRRVLLRLAFLHAGALGALVACGAAAAPTVALVACGFVAGFAVPPTSAVLRALWPELLAGRPDLLQTAYALDSTMIELIFISGPLLTAAIAAVTSPAGALIVSALSVVAGTAMFNALPPAREIATSGEGDRRWLGALACPGVRTLVITSLPAGIAIGMVEVGIPAFARAQSAANAAGLLLATWSFGSGLGGLLYGALPRRPPLRRVHLAVAAALPLSILPLVAANSVAAMALLVIPAGCCIAPLLATRNELVGGVAPEGARTEAYTWPVTAFVGGIALGNAVAGGVVDGPGWQTAFVAAVGAAGGGALVAAVQNRTLRPVAS